MPNGRPPLFSSPNDFNKKVEEYFTYIKGKKKGSNWLRQPEPATITGLILYLGFSHREALADYEKKKGFSDIVKRARLRVEFEYEKKLSAQAPAGSIFALKNMGWKDKTEVESSGQLGITWKEEKTYAPESKTS
mgnify:FL=1